MDWRFDGLMALVSIAAGKAADLVTNQLNLPVHNSTTDNADGHAIFLVSRNTGYGVVEQGVQDEWFINVEEITTGTNRVFPIRPLGLRIAL